MAGITHRQNREHIFCTCVLILSDDAYVVAISPIDPIVDVLMCICKLCVSSWSGVQVGAEDTLLSRAAMPV